MDGLDYRHMRRAESEIIRAQIVILRTLKAIISTTTDSDIVEEVDSKIEDLHQFHYEGKYDDDNEKDDIQYADTQI
jgi:hypothetical protein